MSTFQKMMSENDFKSFCNRVLETLA